MWPTDMNTSGNWIAENLEDGRKVVDLASSVQSSLSKIGYLMKHSGYGIDEVCAVFERSSDLKLPESIFQPEQSL